MSGRGRTGEGRGFEVRVDIPRRRKNIEQAYRFCFGEESARYAHEMVINSGVFALTAQSGVWKTWADYLRRGLQAGPIAWWKSAH